MSPEKHSQDAPMPSSSGSNAPGASDQAAEDQMEICAFCLEEIDDNEACSSTSCSHFAHRECFLRWLENSRTCATCRKEVKSVKMKSGQAVRLPKLKQLELGDPLAPDIPPLDELAFINAVLSSEEDYSDRDYSEDETVVLPTRRTTRQSGPLRMSSADRARENMIARFASSIAVGVGSSRRGRGNPMRLGGGSTTSRTTGGSAGRRQAVAPAEDVDLDELEERMEARMRGRSRRFNFFDDSDDERQAMRPDPRQPRRNRVIIDSDDEMGDAALPENEPRRRTTIESSDEDDEEESEDGSEGSETESDDSLAVPDTSDETDEENSELDESVLDDEPSTSSRRMIPVVRKRRTVKKRKVTKRKRKTTVKKTEGGVVKRRKTKRRKSTKKGGTRKGTKRKRPDREEVADQRQRVRAALPSLSLNGADIDPLSGGEEEDRPAVKRARHSPPSLPVTPAADPMDLLGSILTSQVVAHAPGRYLEQKDGKLVPRESFSRHLDRQERRGILPVDRAEVAPSTSRSTSSSTNANASRAASRSDSQNREHSSSHRTTGALKRPTDGEASEAAIKKPTTSRPAFPSYSLPRLVPFGSVITPLPPPPPSSNHRSAPLPPPPPHPPTSTVRLIGLPGHPSLSNHGTREVKKERTSQSTLVKQEVDEDDAPMPSQSTPLPPHPPPPRTSRVRPIGLPGYPSLSNHGTREVKKESNWTSQSTTVKQEIDEDDAPMPSRSTPLPPPPPPLPTNRYRAKKDDTARHVKQEIESDEEIKIIGLRNKHFARFIDADKREEWLKWKNMDTMRIFTIRTVINEILIPERQAGRIDVEEHRVVMNRVLARFTRRPDYNENEVKEFTRIKLANLLEKKM